MMRRLREVDLADARVADEGAVARPEVADADAALGGDELHVDGAHLPVVEDEVAGLVAPDDLRLRADLELGLVALALGDA